MKADGQALITAGSRQHHDFRAGREGRAARYVGGNGPRLTKADI
jgi:hypothetical protein